VWIGKGLRRKIFCRSSEVLRPGEETRERPGGAVGQICNLSDAKVGQICNLSSEFRRLDKISASDAACGVKRDWRMER
jgi:hypothetical protein